MGDVQRFGVRAQAVIKLRQVFKHDKIVQVAGSVDPQLPFEVVSAPVNILVNRLVVADNLSDHKRMLFATGRIYNKLTLQVALDNAWFKDGMLRIVWICI